MKNRLVVVLMGLSLGVLAACGEVAEAKPPGRSAQVDPVTHEPSCNLCPVEAVKKGHVTSTSRTPVQDAATGGYYCPPCDGEPSPCGDGLCSNNETCSSCSSDCGTCPPSTWCGDGACNGGETSTTCPSDCPSTTSGPVLGRFSRWCGKVNIHTDANGSWSSDGDCVSGCNIGGLEYCQKLWPASIGIRQVAVSSKANNVWANRGCSGIIDEYDGSDEFECVGPPQVVGRISLYCGKVNIHTNASGSWAWDSDCTSGCNIGGVAYCQKFYPNATSIRQVPISSKPNNVWMQRGCFSANEDWDGDAEYECLTN
ncbi:solute carrier organic anion transporter [Hyalangium versicolor]|uniref:solute carrier organic anion transporter n=1 Tax=Hyalangium versicolor TaxID=2861190 RepID=UPI001CCB338B|nr:solute carrier organic anion transporter [Hyalangium versicolor]